ncbi:MAG: LamG domain-containing protein, partial [Pirellulales bacterium]|nr:LamG domain-containing protein [Pirellulales bacterium]
DVPDIENDLVARHLGMVNALLYGGSVRSFELAEIDLTDSTNEPLVLWWLPYNEHGNVCGTVVTIDNPNELPEPSGTEPDVTLEAEPSEGPEENCSENDPCLLVHYTFDESAFLGEDKSCNEYHGTPVGNDVQHVQLSAPYNGAVSFGLNNYIDVPGEVFTDNISAEVTVTLWVNLAQIGQNSVFHGLSNAGGRMINAHVGWPCSPSNVIWDAGNDPTSPWGNGSAGVGYDRLAVAFGGSTDQWHHWAFVKNASASVMKVYMDGQLIATEQNSNESACGTTYTGPATYTLDGTTSFSVHRPDMFQLHGMIDDFRVYKCALGDAQVQAIANWQE